MDTDISALFAFLERCDSEVTGHELSQPEDEVAEKLARFARGECTETERVESCQILRKNPAWIRWLAHRVKLNRPPKKGTGSTVAALT